MADIRIIKGPENCKIVAISIEGRRWVRANMFIFYDQMEVSVIVKKEFLDEIIEMIEEDELIVERSR